MVRPTGTSSSMGIHDTSKVSEPGADGANNTKLNALPLSNITEFVVAHIVESLGNLGIAKKLVLNSFSLSQYEFASVEDSFCELQ